MAYKLRFVQRFDASEEAAFMALEKQFAQLEAQTPQFPKGARWQPYSGREPANTLIWEAEFPTLEAAHDALALLQSDRRHEELLARQIKFFQDAYTEIYRSIDI